MGVEMKYHLPDPPEGPVIDVRGHEWSPTFLMDKRLWKVTSVDSEEDFEYDGLATIVDWPYLLEHHGPVGDKDDYCPECHLYNPYFHSHIHKMDCSRRYK
jgi:hypothetical protein